MVIVDASVWVDFFAGRQTPQVSLLRGVSPRERVGISDLTLCEVLQGVRDERESQRVRGILLTLPVLAVGGIKLAVAAATNYRALRQRGVTVRGTIDCLIATFCIERDHVLLHNDRDFDPFEEHLKLQVLR